MEGNWNVASHSRTSLRLTLIVTLTVVLDLWPWLSVPCKLPLWPIHLQKIDFQRSVGSKDREETDRQTDGRTLPIALPSQLTRSIISVKLHSLWDSNPVHVGRDVVAQSSFTDETCGCVLDLLCLPKWGCQARGTVVNCSRLDGEKVMLRLMLRQLRPSAL